MHPENQPDGPSQIPLPPSGDPTARYRGRQPDAERQRLSERVRNDGIGAAVVLAALKVVGLFLGLDLASEIAGEDLEAALSGRMTIVLISGVSVLAFLWLGAIIWRTSALWACGVLASLALLDTMLALNAYLSLPASLWSRMGLLAYALAAITAGDAVLAALKRDRLPAAGVRTSVGGERVFPETDTTGDLSGAGDQAKPRFTTADPAAALAMRDSALEIENAPITRRDRRGSGVMGPALGVGLLVAVVGAGAFVMGQSSMDSPASAVAPGVAAAVTPTAPEPVEPSAAISQVEEIPAAELDDLHNPPKPATVEAVILRAREMCAASADAENPVGFDVQVEMAAGQVAAYQAADRRSFGRTPQDEECYRTALGMVELGVAERKARLEGEIE